MNINAKYKIFASAILFFLLIWILVKGKDEQKIESRKWSVNKNFLRIDISPENKQKKCG